jgi:RNA polymerase nonessential primary-like sigma factor
MTDMPHQVQVLERSRAEEEIAMPRKVRLQPKVCDIQTLLQRDAAQISLHGGFSREEIRLIYHAIECGGAVGRRARDFLQVANNRLVYAIALRYQHRGLDLEDLVQEGHIGLMRAIERFDLAQGTRFSTYAV